MLFLAFSLLLQVAAAAVHGAIVRTFEEDTIGAPPAGFAVAAGRDAAPDSWRVQREAAGRVLLHEGRPSPADAFAVAVYGGGQYQNVEVTVRLKATGGRRAAGLVWRYQDPLNHYAVYLDLVRQRLDLYRVIRGNRIRLESEDDLELDPDAWHTLRVRQDEGEMRIYLGGARVLTEDDRQLRVPGAIGVVSSGDTTVMFDDVRIEERTGGPSASGRSGDRR
jgi:hypothetical protein